MIEIDPRTFDKRLRIERPVPDNAVDGAGLDEWTPIGKAWANVQDVLPSRGEQLAGGINLATRRARVRMYARSDLAPAMRFVMVVKDQPDRVMQIVSGPASIGRGQYVELMVEDYSTAGNAA